VLFHYFGLETTIDIALVGWITIRLKRSNERTQPRRENYQISGTLPGGIGVGNTCRYKNRRSCANGFASVGIAES